jgi:hypothetical protein
VVWFVDDVNNRTENVVYLVHQTFQHSLRVLNLVFSWYYQLCYFHKIKVKMKNEIV